jgi:2-polyprenyl-3-methyl-5-hydroxy-6-metoxy-1,4-benzoquinol methylase
MTLKKICPICKLGDLKPTELAVTIPSALHRWEEVLGQPLPEKVWDEYQEFGDQAIRLCKCTKCDFGRFEPTVEGTANFYESISATDYYNTDKWEFSCAIKDLRSAGVKRVLDVGCGSGIFLEQLKKSMPDAELFGFDLSGKFHEKLKKRGFGLLSNNSDHLDHTISEYGLFDAITIFQVLEHVSDPVTFLKKYLRFLRPGGKLIITTPDAGGPISKFPGALTEIPPHHLTQWNENTFDAFLPSQGLSICIVRYEPLPDYLWQSYLPQMWDDPIWPAQIFDPIALQRGLVTVGERVTLAIQAMKSSGIKSLHGVPGHTIYVTAQMEDNK